MPEGDTIHKIARRIGPHLEGRRVVGFTTHDLGAIEGSDTWQVTRVAARGKHLLVHFDSSWVLRTHLGMHGRVRMTSANQSPPKRAVFVLTVGPDNPTRVVCARAYRCEFVRESALATHARLARLGPDLLDPGVDIGAVVERARGVAGRGRSLVDVLLDQRIAAGIGNVYKSELMFLHGLHPATGVDELSPDALRTVYGDAVRLLNLNLKTKRRTTVPTRRRPTPASPRLWVYGRAGDPCLECGSAILRLVQGDTARSTYYCPTCQPVKHPPG